MQVVGDKFESPTVVPNRTISAMRDVSALVHAVGTDVERSDSEILNRCIHVFRDIGFSEVLKPISNTLDQSEHEIIQIYMSILIKTIFFHESHDMQKLFLCLLIVVVKCFEERSGPVSIPMTIADIENLTSRAQQMHDSTIILGIVKELSTRIVPSVRTIPFYADHSGFSALRDNQKDAFAKTLSHGVETDRTVSVAPLDDDDVGILNRGGDVIFRLREQSQHNPGFRRKCGEIVNDLGYVIPPPLHSDPEPQLVDVMPARQIKKLLKSGRGAKNLEYPSITNN